MTSLATPRTGAPTVRAPGTTYRLVLGVDARSPRQARNAVRVACAGSDLPGQVVDDAVLIAGELVMYSLRQSGAPVVFVVETALGRVTVRVRDCATVTPGRGSAGGVRGWEVVRRLATSFGYRVGGQRELWATVRAYGDATT